MHHVVLESSRSISFYNWPVDRSEEHSLKISQFSMEDLSSSDLSLRRQPEDPFGNYEHCHHQSLPTAGTRTIGDRGFKQALETSYCRKKAVYKLKRRVWLFTNQQGHVKFLPSV
jgi:hypothetical protein